MTVNSACTLLAATTDVYAAAAILDRLAAETGKSRFRLPADLAKNETVLLGANIADVRVETKH